MSLTITPIVCCCTATPTPAEVCPTSDPCPTRTVRVSVAANPIACDPVSLITPTSCEDFCGGNVAACCPDTVTLEVPTTVFLTGLADAVAAVAWQSYTEFTVDGSGCHLTSTVDCGNTTTTFTEQYVNLFEFTMNCGEDGGFSNCGGDENIAYYPSEAAWTAYAGMRIGVKGCCCEDCACDTPNLCSLIDVSIEARWSLPMTAKQFGFLEGSPYICACDLYDEFGNVIGSEGLYYPFQGDYTLDVTHSQAAVLRFENTIYTSQVDCGLAPGSYQLIRADLSNQAGAVFMCGLGYNHISSACEAFGGEYIEHTSPAPDCSSSTACSRSSLKLAGWSVSVSVDA